MRDILDDIDRFLASGCAVALARVVDTEGSGPREAGAAMAVSERGEVAGSVSGGCVEGAVILEAADVIASGKPTVMEFGVADETAWEVGLACGGRIKVYVEPVTHD